MPLQLEFNLHDNGPFGGQLSFCQDKTLNLAAITGRGGGKTYVGALKTILFAQENPGANILITAPTFAMLRDSTKATFLDLLPPQLIVYHKENDNEILLTNGTKIYFRSTHEPSHLRGITASYWWGDEAAVSSFEAYLVIIGCIRDPHHPGQIVITSTPKGAQHWIYDLFGPENVVRDPEHFKLYNWTTFDNPNLPGWYKENLAKTYVGRFAQQELYGEFTLQTGLVYSGFFNRNVNCGKYFFQDRWPITLAWDFGFGDPTAVLVFQQDGIGRVFQIDEVYTTKQVDEEIVAELRGRPYWGYIRDVVCDSAQPHRIAALNRLGLPARPCSFAGGSKDSIETGIIKVAELLRVDPVLQTPRLFINTETCDSTITEFGLYSYKERMEDGSIHRNLRQRPIDAYNHAMDALRYYICTCVTPTVAPEIAGRRNTYRRHSQLDVNQRRRGR